MINLAEKVFARDGFEAAKLEDIAKDAGYTRGAVYANFDSKEDLFLALLEREISSRIAALEKEMDKVRDIEAKLRVMREFFVNKTLDRRWSLLALEFKLFAASRGETAAGSHASPLRGPESGISRRDHARDGA
jgi:AcrR family transcriptional regulator